MVSRSEMVGAIPACSWKAEAAVCGAFAWCELYWLQLYHYNWLPSTMVQLYCATRSYNDAHGHTRQKSERIALSGYGASTYVVSEIQLVSD